MSSRPKLTMARVGSDPVEYEQQHVHNVYNAIAPHFSATRYKPWPIIEQFLSSLPPGSIGLDSGTGNGKYLPLPLDRPTDIITIGLDRSFELLRIAQRAGNTQRDVLLGDALQNCWRPASFVQQAACMHVLLSQSLLDTGLRVIDRHHSPPFDL